MSWWGTLWWRRFHTCTKFWWRGEENRKLTSALSNRKFTTDGELSAAVKNIAAIIIIIIESWQKKMDKSFRTPYLWPFNSISITYYFTCFFLIRELHRRSRKKKLFKVLLVTVWKHKPSFFWTDFNHHRRRQKHGGRELSETFWKQQQRKPTISWGSKNHFLMMVLLEKRAHFSLKMKENCFSKFYGKEGVISWVTFPSHLKKLRFILRFWLEKLNWGFFHSIYSWKKTTKQLFLPELGKHELNLLRSIISHKKIKHLSVLTYIFSYI